MFNDETAAGERAVDVILMERQRLKGLASIVTGPEVRG